MTIEIDVAEKRLLWNKAAYHSIAELGLFEGKRVELIEGEIVEMSPISRKHGIRVYVVQKVLEGVFAEGYVVVTQIPLELGDISEPQPDAAVYKGTADDYLDDAAALPVLVVEVAESSVRYDRGKKSQPLRQSRHPGILDCQSPGKRAGSVPPA